MQIRRKDIPQQPMAQSDADAVLEALRRTQGLTQEEREVQTGIDQSHWSRWLAWERGERELAPIRQKTRRRLDAFNARPVAPAGPGSAGIIVSVAHAIDSTIPLVTPGDEAAFAELEAAVDRMREAIRRQTERGAS